MENNTPTPNDQIPEYPYKESANLDLQSLLATKALNKWDKILHTSTVAPNPNPYITDPPDDLSVPHIGRVRVCLYRSGSNLCKDDGWDWALARDEYGCWKIPDWKDIDRDYATSNHRLYFGSIDHLLQLLADGILDDTDIQAPLLEDIGDYFIYNAETALLEGYESEADMLQGLWEISETYSSEYTSILCGIHYLIGVIMDTDAVKDYIETSLDDAELDEDYIDTGDIIGRDNAEVLTEYGLSFQSFLDRIIYSLKYGGTKLWAVANVLRDYYGELVGKLDD